MILKELFSNYFLDEGAKNYAKPSKLFSWSVPTVGFSVTNTLPVKFLESVCTKRDINPDEIVCVLADFPSGSEGIIFTVDKIYVDTSKNTDKFFQLNYNEIKNIYYDKQLDTILIHTTLGIFKINSPLWNNVAIYRALTKIKEYFLLRKNLDDKILEENNIQHLFKYWKNNIDILNKKEFKVLITANMSAGKSTLINAIVGKKVSKTMNMSCTAQICKIHNNIFLDKMTVKYDGNFEFNPNQKNLLEINENDNVQIFTPFNSKILGNVPITFIDTPGVNSYFDQNHRIITESYIENNDFDCMIYMLDATNISTDDDKRHLEYIKSVIGVKPVIFVINKLDKYNEEEDSVYQTYLNVKQYLENAGFIDANIVPISANAGYLAKKMLNNCCDEDETDEVNQQYRILKRYDLSKYSDNNVEALDNKYENLLKYSGINNLELNLLELIKNLNNNN